MIKKIRTYCSKRVFLKSIASDQQSSPSPCAHPMPVKFIDFSCRPNRSPKILIAYASEFGSTGEVAEAIGRVFCNLGAYVEVKWIKNVENLERFDAILIGGAIQYDKWMKESADFVDRHQNTLKNKSVALFFTCLVLAKATDKAAHKALSYKNNLFSHFSNLNLLDIGAFAGVLDYRYMSIGSRCLASIVYLFLNIKPGDYRDWNAIHYWAKGIYAKLNLKTGN